MRTSTWRVAVVVAVLAAGTGAGVVPSVPVWAAPRAGWRLDVDVAGHWKGSIKLPGTELAFDVDIRVEGAGMDGDISIPMQGAKDMALEKVRVDGRELTFAIAGVPGAPTFTGTVSPDGTEVNGSFTQGGVNATFSMKRGAAPAEAAADAMAGFGEWLDGAREAWKAPGVSVVVVKGDAVVYSGASGKRDVEAGAPMTPDTLLAIGSSTKAFTTMVLATLVDEGKLEWDTPVRRYMPDFAIADEDAARQMTPVDLVTHRSGMPRHDLVWYNSALSRGEIFERLRHLPSNKGVRAEFQYNNLMYLAAGVLIERLTRETWEEAVRARILAPLGMSRSVFSPADAQKDPDHALAYREDDDVVKRTAYRDIASMGPAGSIYSSANEMAKWVRAQLGQQTASGKELVTDSTLTRLHSVHMHMGGPPAPADQQVVNAGYALGWFVDVYRGHRRVHHGGNIDGFSALVVLLPDDDAGIVVLTNMNASALPGLVARHASDRILGLERVDWNAKALAEREQGKAMVKEAESKKGSVRQQGTTASHPLAAFVGRYEHPGYGVIDVGSPSDAGLALTFNRITAPLEHWHYDVFNCLKNPEDPTLEDTKVQFLTGMDGEVEALRVSMDANFDPTVFKRLPDEQLRDPAYLAKLAGTYQMGPRPMTFDLRGGTLWAVVPGQPAYELIPGRHNTFALKGLSGFSVRFDLDDSGAPKAATFIQPNGVFAAERKN